MREYITADTLANTVSMLASSRKGAIWIADHDEEARFYEGKCAHPDTTVIPAPREAHAVLRTLKNRGLRGVVATVPPSTAERLENEFSSSFGDVTSLLVFSPSCKRILEELAGRNWYEAAELSTKGFQLCAMRIACTLGVVRETIGIAYGDRERSLNLLKDIVDWSSFVLAEQPDQALISREKWEKAAQDRALTSCSGEDLLSVLAASLLYFRPRGVKAHQELKPGELLSALQVGFHIEEFELDQMYWDLREWQCINRLPVLREWRTPEPFGVLLDQRYWEADLQRYLSRQKRFAMAVFKIDLDNFKDVNDHLGHTCGDDAIRLYSEIINDELGIAAEIYRRGGDEIIAFSPSISPQEARRRAEGARAGIEKQFEEWSRKRGLAMAPTASIGLVICSSGDPKEQVIAAADDAQKKAKLDGKNRVIEIAIS